MTTDPTTGKLDPELLIELRNLFDRYGTAGVVASAIVAAIDYRLEQQLELEDEDMRRRQWPEAST